MAIKCATGSLNKVCTYLLTYTYLLLLLWSPVIQFFILTSNISVNYVHIFKVE